MRNEGTEERRNERKRNASTNRRKQNGTEQNETKNVNENTQEPEGLMQRMERIGTKTST